MGSASLARPASARAVGSVQGERPAGQGTLPSRTHAPLRSVIPARMLGVENPKEGCRIGACCDEQGVRRRLTQEQARAARWCR